MNVKRFICMLLSAILVLGSMGTCLADAKSVELILPQGDIYTNKAEFTVSTAGGSVEKFTYYLDGEQIALGDEDGKLIVSEDLQLPSAGNHILKVVAEFEGGQKAEDSKRINVYHKVVGAYKFHDFNNQKLLNTMYPANIDSQSWDENDAKQSFIEKGEGSNDYYVHYEVLTDTLAYSARPSLAFIHKSTNNISFKSGTARFSFDIKVNSCSSERIWLTDIYTANNGAIFIQDGYIVGAGGETNDDNALSDGWNHIDIINYRDENNTKAPERSIIMLNGDEIYNAGGKRYDDGNGERDSISFTLLQNGTRNGEGTRAGVSFDNMELEQSLKLGISKMSYLKNEVWTDFSDGIIPNDAQKIKVYFLDAFDKATLTSDNVSMSSKSGVKTLSDEGIEYNALEKSIIFTPDDGFIAGEDVKITMSEDTGFYSIGGEGPFLVEKPMEISFSTSVEDNISEIDLSVDSASVSVTKGTSSELKDMILILAAYNAGELTALQTEAIDVDSLAKGETKGYDVALADKKGGTSLKAFLWESLSSMTPVKSTK